MSRTYGIDELKDFNEGILAGDEGRPEARRNRNFILES